ncbi:MAG: PHP domain-containing protein [Kiritimatiellia bacterium]
MIDLHIHSTHSDGSETPEALVVLGAQAGLKAMALTDHDNVHGAVIFLQACRKHRITGLTGVEISAEVPSGTLHILGYGVDPTHRELLHHLDRVLDGREWRNEQILARLQKLGFSLEWAEVASLAGEDVVGRPHFARALQNRGFVSGTQEAFDKYLAKGKPAYVDRYRLLPADGIRLIRAAGGLPVMAHPFTWIDADAALEPALVELMAQGLGGIEAYYPEYASERTVTYLRMSRKLGLVVTGGTDFHGTAKPETSLGTGSGNFQVPDSLLPPLLAALPSRVGVAEA